MYKKTSFITLKPLNSLLKHNLKLDVYIIFLIGEKKIVSSISKSCEKYPNWNESFTFLLEEIENKDIIVQFWEYNIEKNYGNNTFLCENTLKYDEINENLKNENNRKKMMWIKLNKNGNEFAELLLEVERFEKELYSKNYKNIETNVCEVKFEKNVSETNREKLKNEVFIKKKSITSKTTPIISTTVPKILQNQTVNVVNVFGEKRTLENRPNILNVQMNAVNVQKVIIPNISYFKKGPVQVNMPTTKIVYHHINK